MHKCIMRIVVAVVSALRALELSITAGLEQLGPANRAGVQCSSPGECSHSVSCRIETVSAPYRMREGAGPVLWTNRARVNGVTLNKVERLHSV